MSSVTVTKSKKVRHSLGPSNVTIQQSKGMGTLRGSMSGGMTMRRNVVGYSSLPLESGHIAAKTSQAVRGVVEEKGKEKKEIGDLNEKLAAYIETRKYNECQILALKDENEKLKNLKIPDWQDIRSEYTEEIESHREALTEAKSTIADLQAELAKLKEELMSKDEEIDQLRNQNGELENRLKTLTTTIGDLEGEIRALRTELENSSLSNSHLKQDNERLREEVERLTNDLEHARAEQIRAFDLVDCERNEKEFIDETLNKEIEILKEQIRALKSTQPDYKKYFTSGFKDAVAEMQRQNDKLIQDHTARLQAQYESKMAALDHMRRPDATDSTVTKTENKNLKSSLNSSNDQINKLRMMLEDMQGKYDQLLKDAEDESNAHMKEIMELREQIMALNHSLQENEQEVDKLNEANLGMSLEIETYRKLLDGEMGSLKSALESTGNVQSSGGQYMQSLIRGGGGGGGGGSSSSGFSSSASQNSNPDVSKPTKKSPSQGQQPQKSKQPKTAISQSTGKVNLQKKCRGALQFSEVPTNGEFAELENNSKNEMDLGGYQITRKHGKGTSQFTFPPGSRLAGYKKCRVYGNAYDSEADMDGKKFGIQCFVAEKKNANNWGSGNGEFKLFDSNMSEKASASITFT